MSENLEKDYVKEVDFILREKTTRLKGIVDLLYYGVLDEMKETEKHDILKQLKAQTDGLLAFLTKSIIPGNRP